MLRTAASLITVAMAAVATIQAPAFAAALQPLSTPFIRAADALHHMRLDPKGRFLAFISPDGMGLSVVDFKSKAIWNVSQAQIGNSFFWSPDGYRLFYREQFVGEDGKVKSVLKAYDCYLNRSVTMDLMPFPTGILTFDPRDLRFHLMSEHGIRTKRIYFPDERLAKWQVAQRDEQGKWLATQGGILWVTHGGFSMRRLEDDGTKLESFDISPDGKSIAWATAKGRLYTSTNGQKPRLVGFGRDPQWHPTKSQLLYAGARMVGNRAVSYDLRVATPDGSGRFLTATQHSDERWPQWHPQGQQILYTVAKTTDLFILDFMP